MKHKTSAFYSDRIQLSIIDIIRLLSGKELKGCGVIVSMKSINRFNGGLE